MLARCCGCSPLSDILRCRKQHIIHLVGDSTDVIVSASKRRCIIKFRDQHYPGGHRSWISTETTSTRSFLFLGRHDGMRTWKSFDRAAMERLHAKGLISDQVGKANPPFSLTKACAGPKHHSESCSQLDAKLKAR